MRVNNKGFTVVELVLSFAFVSILTVTMYGIIANYKDRQQMESIRNSLINFKSKVTIDIQNDISKYFLDTIDYCKNGDNRIEKCLILTFMNKTSKKLEIKEETKIDSIENDDGSVENIAYNVQYIKYGDTKYSVPDAKFVNFVSDYMLEFTTVADDLENNMALYKINIGIKHGDLKEDYGIHLTALGNNNVKYNVTPSYNEYKIGQILKMQIGNKLQKDFYVIEDSSKYNGKLKLLAVEHIGTSVFNLNVSDGNEYSNSKIEITLNNLTKTWNMPSEIRLITAEEVAFLANMCPRYKDPDIGAGNLSGGPAWLYAFNYWTMSPSNGTDSAASKVAWYVDSAARFYKHYVSDPFYIRPVITIDKKYVASVVS